MSQIKNRHPQTYDFLCEIDDMGLSEKELDQLISEYKWHRKQNIAIVSSSAITNIFTNPHIANDLGEIEFLDEKFQEMKSRSGPHDYLMVDFTTTPPSEELYIDVFDCDITQAEEPVMDEKTIKRLTFHDEFHDEFHDGQTRFLGIPKEEQSNHYLDLKFFSNRRSNVRRKDDRDELGA